MAIIPTTKTTIARYAAGLYGVKLGNQTLNAVLDDVKDNNNASTGISGLNPVMNGYYAPFAGMTSAQVAAIVVANAGIVQGSYGLSAVNVSDAVAMVTAQINAAAPLGHQGVAISNVLAAWSNEWTADPVFGPAARAWNLKIAQANAYSAVNTEDVAFGAVNTEFVLTALNDRITGTDGDDTFVAGLGSLNNGDAINGGGGYDTLKAMVGGVNNGVVAPTISNVEHLQFQAQFRTTDSGDNNLADEQIVKVDFNTNVTNVTGFEVIENNNSRADLIIEDVRIANNQVTKDITIVMRETDPGNVDYGVYFDQNSLRNVSTSGSQINLRVLDTYNTSLGNAPLKDSPYGSFKFTYQIKGEPAVSVALASQAIQDAQTFPEMVIALQAAADGIFGAGAVTVSLGAKYFVPDSVTFKQVEGTEIVLSAKGDITFTDPVGSGWLATDVVPATSGLYTTFTVGGSTATELVTSNIILDDVGRGSTGGDLVIGGMSVGETSTSKGVQKFLIEVQDNSKLQTINSTNNSLQEVVIVNGDTSRVDNASSHNENQKNAGSLTVNGKVTDNSSSGVISGTNNTPLPGSVDQHNGFGFSDVRVIDGSAMTGKLAFTAEITTASIAKYLNLKDGAPAQPAADNVAFVYSGGGNNDVMDITIDSAFAAATNTLTGREDFTFTANGGAGADNITVKIGGAKTSFWLVDQRENKNLTINAGDGDDTVRTPGDGDFIINAGAGNDTVYTDNTGNKATWIVNAANTDLADLQSTLATTVFGGAATSAFMYKGQLVVTFSGANVGGGVMAGAFADSVAAPFTNGFEVVVDIPTGDNYAVTQLHINQAIKAAINDNDVLKKLVVANDGPGSTLSIESLIDGLFSATDLSMTVRTQALTPAEEAAALNALKLYTKDSTKVATDVSLANTASASTLNAIKGLSGAGAGAGSVFAQSTVTTPAVTEVATLTISAGIVAGESITVNGLTINTGLGLTAVQVEAILENGGGIVGDASYTGAYNPAWTASAGVLGTVVYTSAVAGPVVDLAITDSGTTSITVATGTQGAAAITTFGNMAGSQSTANTNNTINLGDGANDIVVLSTSNTAVETIKLTGSDFGKNTIVNFTDGAGASADKLDFTSYLTNKTTNNILSNSVESEIRIDTSVVHGTNANVAANSVTVLNGITFSATETFAGLNAANLLAAINSTNTAGAADWGNLGDASLNALASHYTSTAAATYLVGGIAKAIVMVENTGNEGEYKVFELAYNGLAVGATAVDFTSATLIGTLDFGNQIGGLTAANNLV